MKLVEIKINQILANWNPINVPSDLAQDEYKPYILSIFEKSNDKNLLFDYLCNLLTKEMGLEFDMKNEAHIKELQEICNKIKDAVSQYNI